MADKILIVEDNELILNLVQTILKKHKLISVTNFKEAQKKYIQNLDIGCVISELRLKYENGIQLTKYFKIVNQYLPVIIMTGETNMRELMKIRKSGARNIISKPFSPIELLIAVENSLEIRKLMLKDKDNQIILEKSLILQSEISNNRRIGIIQALVGGIQNIDKYTAKHSLNVAQYSKKIGLNSGLDFETANELYEAGCLHDIGKAGIPYLPILTKPSNLNPNEWKVMKMHPQRGSDELKQYCKYLNFEKIDKAILQHHEKWDGTGYPNKLQGEKISLFARIIAVADSYDAMTSNRAYRNAMPHDEAIRKIKKETGKHFDPNIVKAVLKTDLNGRTH